MRVLGMISGTSHDGIDAAVVEFTRHGRLLRGRLVHSSATPYPAELRARLAAALPPANTTFAEVCQLDTLIGQSFAEAAAQVIADAGPVDLVVSHGQTVYHWIAHEKAQGTLQVGQPAWLAERTGAPVVSDVRIRDITAGGHGAPLVSYLDSLLLGALPGVPAALNLGGIANITIASNGLIAYDIGPAGALVDAVVARAHPDGPGYDVDGKLAASGTVDETLLAVLLDDPYYRAPAPKSTGKELFHIEYLDQAVIRAATAPNLADLVATVTELTVRTIVADARAAGVTTLVMSGGGTRNPVIVEGLRSALPEVNVTLSDELGVPRDDKEAIAFALLGWCTWHGLPGNHPDGTGAAGPRVLGSLTPGAAPLRLPEPVETPPEGLEWEAGDQHG